MNGEAKGIILAGGANTRLYPATIAVSKQLLPVYDKPMIYYPLSLLVAAGIREVLIITTPRDVVAFKSLLGNGSQWGVRLQYAVQERAEGIAQALVIGETFLAGANVVLSLGDNLFDGSGIEGVLSAAAKRAGATIFCSQVTDPSRYGVAQFDGTGRLVNLIEKPKTAVSRWAVTGIYVFDGRCSRIAKDLSKSARGEYEIVDVERAYLYLDGLKVEKLAEETAWLDMGTHESLVEAAEFVRVVERRRGRKIGCVEEAAYRRGFIDGRQLEELATAVGGAYGDYLRGIIYREQMRAFGRTEAA